MLTLKRRWCDDGGGYGLPVLRQIAPWKITVIRQIPLFVNFCRATLPCFFGSLKTGEFEKSGHFDGIPQTSP